MLHDHIFKCGLKIGIPETMDIFVPTVSIEMCNVIQYSGFRDDDEINHFLKESQLKIRT